MTSQFGEWVGSTFWCPKISLKKKLLLAGKRGKIGACTNTVISFCVWQNKETKIRTNKTKETDFLINR